jgi:hypothetical protein
MPPVPPTTKRPSALELFTDRVEEQQLFRRFLVSEAVLHVSYS